MRQVVTVGLAVVAVAALLAFVPTYNSPQRLLTVSAPIAQTGCAFNGIQSVFITGSPTGGTWVLSLGLAPTPSYGVGLSAPSAATLTTDLGTLNFDDPSGNLHNVNNNVLVTGTYPNYTMTFSGPVYNQVPQFISSNTFTGGTTPKVHTATDPQDQTPNFSKLVSGAADNSTLTLPPNSCWEIDGHFPVGNVGSDMFINDPNGPAQPTANLIDGGNTTVAITVGSPVTSISVTTSGHDDIPNGTIIALTNAGGGTQNFTTVGDTPPNTTPATITVTTVGGVATSNFPITGANSPTNMSGFYTQLPFAPLNGTSVPSGAHLYVSNGTSTMTFVTNAVTPVGGGVCGCFNVVGKAMNDRYTVAATTMIPIPQVSSITLDGSSAWDIPANTTLTVAQSGCSAGGPPCSDFFHTTADAPAGDASPIPVNAKFPAVPLDTNSNVYNTGNGLHITGHTNLTINGNGASLVQTACQPSATFGDAPIVFATQDTGLTLENMTITGATNWPGQACTGRHGVAFEKAACIIAESEVNLTLVKVGAFACQGDGMSLQLPVDFGNVTGALDTNVVVSNSTFDAAGGGYHGLVAEAVGPTASCPNCGAKFVNDYWANWPEEMMDFEVDAGQTVFDTGGGCTSLPGGLCPTAEAQDNMLFATSDYVGWCKPWFTSLQGSGNGIQEQNLAFTGNTLVNTGCPAGAGDAPFMQVNAHTPIGDPPQFWTQNWVIKNNNETQGGFGPTTSTGCVFPPFHSASNYQGLVNLAITHNTFPVQFTDCGNPHIEFTSPIDTHNYTLGDNDFTGAVQPAPTHPDSSNENYLQCGNNWGAAGTSTLPNPPNGTPDPACPPGT